MNSTKIFSYILISVIIGLLSCTSDPQEPTGTFNVTLSGGLNDQLQGNARFNLLPSSTNGRIIINLEQSESVYIRLTFFNPDPAQIFLEPGTYTVVDQAGQNVTSEVLVDYISQVGSFSASSGAINVGIVKDTQIKGDLVNILFNTINVTCNGSFDAIPE
ncbi:MAG: hypothetical protein KFF73_16355 [Cyclobacteriaceae bacterium]|nr:hypothetical protein [Cyclobacteriaceae bacterium]